MEITPESIEIQEKLKKNMGNKRVHIDTTCNIQDYEYVKKNHLKFSQLLANAINVHRTALEEGINSDAINYYKNKIVRLQETIQTFSNFINSKNLMDEYLSK